MNKSALKTFATSARKELLKKVEAKAMKIGITEDNIKKAEIESSDAIYIDGKQLSKEEKVQRDRLIERINQIGFKRVMEEVAYTWFNRFTALRYMEVNEYLPTDVRVLSSTNLESADPDMINEALSLDLEIDKEYVYELKLNNKTEELFKYLIIKHCNDLNRYLPFMFETIDDYTEILFPEGLLAKDSFIRKMTNTDVIPEDNWRKVEVIGWLYQYYIAEEKDRVIKAKKKYKTEEIPFATQLFTPDWIVRYMVQNSLGRYWIESHPEHRDLLSNWEFYLENPTPEPDFEKRLASYINKDLKVEDIKCYDPAMGSGHILIYMFDVLYEIYSKCGYMEREIPRLIIENNLYGLDIDDRAYQLACFSIVMKAMEYNSRLFRTIERDGLVLNLYSIQETNQITDEEITYLVGERNGIDFNNTKEFIDQFKDAKTLGSLIKVQKFDKCFLEKRINLLKTNPSDDLFEEQSKMKLLETIPRIISQAEVMVNSKYDIVVTNPPYMGVKFMSKSLAEYMSEEYPNNKLDTFSAFIELCLNRVKENGQLGFVTPFVWMYINAYKKLREFIVENKNISSLIQLEYNAFPEVTVPVCTFTLRNYNNYLEGEYVKLSAFPGADLQPQKTLEAVQNPQVDYRFSVASNEFNKIKGSPIGFWASRKVRDIFLNNISLGDIAYPKVGQNTGDNERFLRLWFEVDYKKIGFNYGNQDEANKGNKKWFPYNKGGKFRKWYGNHEYVINWENDAKEIKEYAVIRNNGKHWSRYVQNLDSLYKEGITWSDVSSTNFGVRYTPKGFIFDVKGSSMFPEDTKQIRVILAFLCTKIVKELLDILNPTISFQTGDLRRLPYFNLTKEEELNVIHLAEENIQIAKLEWDSFETSWNFKKHPLISYKENSMLIEDSFNNWSRFMDNQFKKLKENEEKINEIFISSFGLQDEMNHYIDEKEITIRRANSEREIKSFISYAVGCMFGRYSLEKDGVNLDGFRSDDSTTFKVDADNILPILSMPYFKDDIVTRFIDFVKVVFGQEKLAENLEFIANILGIKNGETAKEAIRRYFLTDFFKNHLQIYNTRGRTAPIYWLFTSGKQKAFNCLIYIHRYDKTTLSRIRTDYLHDYQIRLDAEKKELLSIIEGDHTTKEISNAKKELKVLDKKIEELKQYDELLHHMADMQIEINLDDGVPVNYEKFKGLVAKI